MADDNESVFQRHRGLVIGAMIAIALPIAWFISDAGPGTTPSGGASARPSSPWIWLLRFSNALSPILLTAVVVLLARLYKATDMLSRSSDRLQEVSDGLQRIGDRLEELCQSTRLSETAKAIAYRDTERAELTEAVRQKLGANEFEAAYELIDEIGRRSDHGDLAEQLRAMADRRRQTLRDEKIAPVIAQVEELLDREQWSKASVQIEGLINVYPDSERVRSMRQHLHQRKEAKKKALLSEWDEAVRHQDTDRSLVVLKDLDLYLTPNEALALQEAAKDVFRTKLHNLGVRFSLAVTDRNWGQALEVGQQIITDFPNSRMCEEIRGKLDILKQNVSLGA